MVAFMPTVANGMNDDPFAFARICMLSSFAETENAGMRGNGRDPVMWRLAPMGLH